jgi:hypothetical protein
VTENEVTLLRDLNEIWPIQRRAMSREQILAAMTLKRLGYARNWGAGICRTTLGTKALAALEPVT